MPVRLHHIVAGAHDLPGPARFWTQAPGWMNLSEREIVIGTEEDAPAGMCFMPVTDPKTVKNRVQITGFFPAQPAALTASRNGPQVQGPAGSPCLGALPASPGLSPGSGAR